VIGVRSAIGHRRIPNWLLVYGTLIVMAEVVLIVISPIGGIALHAAILIGLASHNTFARTPKDPQIPILMLLPLVRLLGIVMLIPEFPTISWYALAGAPALVGTLLVLRATLLSPAAIGLGRPDSSRESLLFALTGIPLGLLLTGLVGPRAALHGEPSALVFVAVVVPFVVLLEELIFRGALQQVTAARAPNLALLVPNVLYASLYLGSGGHVALAMGGVGILFSAGVLRTGSLWGVLGAHFLMRVVLQVDTLL
jgi:membrane protease YdiL (CAAX protease family)